MTSTPFTSIPRAPGAVTVFSPVFTSRLYGNLRNNFWGWINCVFWVTKVNLWNPEVAGAEKYSRVGVVALSASINDLDLYNCIFFLSAKTLTKYDTPSSSPSSVLFSAL